MPSDPVPSDAVSPVSAAPPGTAAASESAESAAVPDHTEPAGHAAAGVSDAPLTTPWSADVDPDRPLTEHPRPQLARDRWLCLNGRWEYTTRAADGELRRGEWIVVPFPPESALSGIGRADRLMWYRRTFQVPAEWCDCRVLLRFGAVDQVATVWVNHQLVTRHEGGYTAFSADITEVLRGGEGEVQEVVVRAEDSGNSGTFPVGKQANQPGGILYTGASGIWQTVWLEAVPRVYVESLDIRGDLTGFDVTVHLGHAGAERVEVAVRDDGAARAGHAGHAGRGGLGGVDGQDGADGADSGDGAGVARGAEVARVTGAPGQRLRVEVPQPRLWSPESPHLYGLVVRVVATDTDSNIDTETDTVTGTATEGLVVDEVRSYAGLRTVGLVADEQGRPRVAVNGRATFLHGLLDQGYWPDGVYTAPTDEALRYDLAQTKALGFNTVRKHVKVEPARWYYWADRLGLLVWQDMPSLPVVLDNPPGPQAPPVGAARARFEAELAAVLGQLRSVTALVVWTPFNEGWGEYDTARIAQGLTAADPARLVVADSGVNCCHSHPDTGVGPSV